MTKRNAGIAAGHRLTAEAAQFALRDGGSAVDAAIAGLWTACVCEPVLASPGGGGFMMIGDHRRMDCLDFFVDTPAKQSLKDRDICSIEADFGTTTQAFTIGAASTAVPGMVCGLFAAHERYGRLPMSALVAHAASIARDGVAITPYQRRLIEIVEPIMRACPESWAMFGSDDGAPRPASFRNPDFAEAVEEVGREGLKAVRHGEIARAMVAAQSQGSLTANDLLAYQPIWRDPLLQTACGAHHALNPPPSACGTLIADMLAQASETNRPDIPHVMANIDAKWLKSGRNIIKFTKMNDFHFKNSFNGTTHISVVDSDGHCVSATISNGEGNGIMVPGCGFMLNNMLGEDDVNPAGINDWTPGMRLSSMMAPTVSRGDDGSLLTIGSGGSNRIRSAIFQVLHHHFASGLSVDAAINRPRMHVEAGHLDFEDDFPDGERAPLAKAFPDHLAWSEPSMYFGGVHAVRRARDGQISGAGDHRRDGVFVAA